MTHRALVVPAAADQPCTVIEWERGGELLALLYGTIGCDTVDCFDVPIDGADLTAWVDGTGFYASHPIANLRFRRFAHALGHPLAQPIVGTVVLTEGADDDGETLGLRDELLADLQRALASPP
jgi:hypothetical protein